MFTFVVHRVALSGACAIAGLCNNVQFQAVRDALEAASRHSVPFSATYGVSVSLPKYASPVHTRGFSAT
jgi:hypothetical protein